MMEEEERLQTSPQKIFYKLQPYLQRQRLKLKLCDHQIFQRYHIEKKKTPLINNKNQFELQVASFKIRQLLLEPNLAKELENMSEKLKEDGIRNNQIQEMLYILKKEIQRHIDVQNPNIQLGESTEYQILKLCFHQSNYINERLSQITMDDLFFIKDHLVDHKNPEYLNPKWYHSHLALIKRPYSLFDNKEQKSDIQDISISPKHVKQGDLLTCYLLAPMASLAKYFPQIIIKRFIFYKNQAHFYPITLFIDGKWEIILCDTAFLTHEQELIGAQMVDSIIWPMLLQKAYAKKFGHYCNIQWDDFKRGIEALTGASSFTYQFGDISSHKETEKARKEKNKKYIQQIKQKQRLNWIVNCRMKKETKQKKQKTGKNKSGLISQHCYSLFDFIPDMQIQQNMKETLYILYDPLQINLCERQQYLIKKKWTQVQMARLQINSGFPEGVFLMTQKYFIECLQDVYVSMVHKDYTNSWLNLEKYHDLSIGATFQIQQQGHYQFTIHLIDRYMTTQTKKWISSMELRIKKSFQRVQQSLNIHYDGATIRKQIQKGQYILVLKIQDSHSKVNKYRLSSYGPKYIQMKQVQQIQFEHYCSEFSNKDDIEDTEVSAPILHGYK